MNKTKRVAFVIVTLFAATSAAQACTLKAGMVGGEIKLAAGPTPVCGAERAKIIEGIKASYQKQGKPMPKYRWLEAFVISDKDDAKTGASIKMTNYLFGKGYVPDALNASTGEKFGYYSSLYKNRKTGRMIQKFFFTEPRGTIMWKKLYMVFMGY